jgi:hypothetical protein
MLSIDQGRIGGLGRLDPRNRITLAAVHRDSDDDEALIGQLLL